MTAYVELQQREFAMEDDGYSHTASERGRAVILINWLL